MNEIASLASGIYSTEFESDSSAANLTQISGWLTENLGLLNTLINTSYSGLDPKMGLEEQAIYKQLYLYNYYNRQARNVLRGIVSVNSSGQNILQVSDGDNSITFVNRNEVGKVYRDLSKDAKEKLDKMVDKYNIYSAQPLQVGGIEAGYFIEETGSTLEGDSSNIPDDGIFDAGLE